MTVVIELLGLVATCLAVWGVLLNNRLNRACFVVWVVSNSITLFVHLWAGIISLAVRDLIFLILAVEGWILWSAQKKSGQDSSCKH